MVAAQTVEGTWTTLHTVTACPFSARWQWVWFPLDTSADAPQLTAVRLDIHSNMGADIVQLGHMWLFTAE